MLPSGGADSVSDHNFGGVTSRPLSPTRYGNGYWQDTIGRRTSTKYIPS